MNGPDLRFLAERASVLEDRTVQRLDEVHARIALARERRSVGAALGAAVLVIALLAGLAIVDSGWDRGSEDPAKRPTDSASVGAEAARGPARGTCWAVPPELAVDPSYYFDDSRQVPCDQPHTTETVATLPVAEATKEEADARGVSCGIQVAEYLNIDNESWIHWAAASYLPSREQVADGAAWVRCDAVLPGSWWGAPGEHATSARTLTRSAFGIADEPTDELWTCLAQSPTLEQPKVPCDRPHAYEATGTLAGIGGIANYPSAEMLRTEAQNDCSPAVPKRLAGVSVMALWDQKGDNWQPRYGVRGVCFMYRANGGLLPPR